MILAVLDGEHTANTISCAGDDEKKQAGADFFVCTEWNPIRPVYFAARVAGAAL